MYNSSIYSSNDNGQRAFHSTASMQAVRSFRRAISNINAIIGGALFGTGVLIFIISSLVNHSAAVLSLQITGGALVFSGIVELIVSAFFRSSARREQTKLEHLKAEGQNFQGEITQIRRHVGVRIGQHMAAYIECSYVNNEGKTCLVKSNSFLYAPHDNFSVWVYVNPRDPYDYAVEIFTHAATKQGVYDYR